MQKYLKEPFCALSHLFGVLLSVVGLVVLLQAAGDSSRAVTASIIYGTTLILLFLASALTHGPHFAPETAARFERCDYAAIFLLIAGTYTPFCLLVVRGPLGWTMLGIEWLLAIVGVWSVFYGSERSKSKHVAIYLAMGWLFVLALGPITTALTNPLLSWLIGGGIFYSVGAIIFLRDWPHLLGGRFSAHDLWHVFVLGGSSCHFVLVNHFVQIGASIH